MRRSIPGWTGTTMCTCAPGWFHDGFASSLKQDMNLLVVQGITYVLVVMCLGQLGALQPADRLASAWAFRGCLGFLANPPAVVACGSCYNPVSQHAALLLGVGLFLTPVTSTLPMVQRADQPAPCITNACRAVLHCWTTLTF